jgi:endonuclease III
MESVLSIKALQKSPLYSEELEIDLKGKRDDELFKWLLASTLFGARISETIAAHTYKAFKKYDLLTPDAITKSGWDFLINPVMKEGGYVRYDEKTAAKILTICGTLKKNYRGSLTKLHSESKNCWDLENRLLEFYGIGPVTVNIFLRELRPFWKRADPEPLPIVKKIAIKLKIDLAAYERKSLSFARLEAGLIRLRRKMSI